MKVNSKPVYVASEDTLTKTITLILHSENPDYEDGRNYERLSFEMRDDINRMLENLFLFKDISTEPSQVKFKVKITIENIE